MASLLFKSASRLQRNALRPVFRQYSAQTAAPLIRVTDLPAPHSGHIRILELNRPDARNAISVQMLADLRKEIDAVAAQYGPGGEELPVQPLMGGAMGPNKRGVTRALIIASADPQCFCAGADLRERKNMSKEETARFLEFLRSSLTTLSELPIPTISAISSIAVGGGLEIGLSTTFRVLTSNAQVGLPETRLGIIPGAGGTYRLPALIGHARARDLILTGRRVTAAEAYFLGLADRLVEVMPEEGSEIKEGQSEAEQKKLREKLLETARRDALSQAVVFAEEICNGAPVAVRAALKATNWANPDMEDEMYKRVLETDDRYEALAAFSERRKPVYTGK